jgi:hypothetical protein
MFWTRHTRRLQWPAVQSNDVSGEVIILADSCDSCVVDFIDGDLVARNQQKRKKVLKSIFYESCLYFLCTMVQKIKNFLIVHYAC